MSPVSFAKLLNEYNSCLRDCRQIYLNGAQRVIREAPHLLDISPRKFMDLMEDLHRGLLIKLYVSIAGVDHVWNRKEEQLAGVLFFHLWQRQLNEQEVRDSIRHISRQAAEMNWLSLVQPFQRIAILNESAAELETLVIRLGHLIAKADGKASSLELKEIKSIQDNVLALLRPQAMQRPPHLDQTQDCRHAIYDMDTGSQAIKRDVADPDTLVADVVEPKSNDPTVDENPAPNLEESLAELDRLIGMDQVKKEVRTLINFLDVQRKRKEAGLPETKISLHMVFAGNPGTGKTTVARILGKIYGAMGILAKGHLVETDRSGLVAEYAGQTGPKTNRTIDQAMDGVLFIDEAYSLVSSEGNDPYGAEAIQTLLKRMEDNRDRLIVILAGYPNEMDRMVLSNPGLSSRLGRRIVFEDYSPLELGKIFGVMCKQYEYSSQGLTRAKLLVGLKWLYERRDKHFGNGRLIRNLFEASIRNLANRVIESPEFSKRLLSHFVFEDIDLPSVPAELLSDSYLERVRFETTCDHCPAQPKAPATFLGRRVKCNRCEKPFRIEWGNPIEVDFDSELSK